jgi:hypothetical protein
VSRLLRWLSVLLATTIACASPALTEPVVANTGTARSNDGYEAALAAAEAGGYSVVVDDAKHAFVRVRSRTSTETDPNTAVFLELKAWKGSIDVQVKLPHGLLLDERRLHQVLGERRELLWAAATRARLIAGESLNRDIDPLGRDVPGLSRLPSAQGAWGP